MKILLSLRYGFLSVLAFLLILTGARFEKYDFLIVVGALLIRLFGYFEGRASFISENKKK
jgi:hypothetical protein